MSRWIVTHEALLRASAFIVVFMVVAIAETVVEARPLRVPRQKRWPHNLGLTVLNTVVLRLIFPLGATSAALWSAAHGIGFLQLVALPPIVKAVLAIAMLDLTIYGQHVLFHSVPLLFRFHQVHHADIDFDVTLGTRFHPVEMVLSMVIKVTVLVVIGASAAAVVLFEIILAATSLFNHGNLRVPRPIDRVLRWLVVTPAMHAVHHSAERSDRNSNFGFSVPWWDRLFGTYRERPVVNPPLIGMPSHQSGDGQTLRWMLGLPFRSMDRRRPADRQIRQEAA